jgi:methyltransferase (TIGR00027 family)
VAAFRATLERPHTPEGDPDAQARLIRGMRPVGGAKLREHLTARTRFFDEQVLAAIADGVEQTVVLGAGYDDRALRFSAPSVRYFEVDLPETQRDKRRRLERIGADLGRVVLVGADFRADDTAAALADAGHDAARSSLFICEGLLIYLDQDATVELLGAARARSNPTSRLAASLATHPAAESSEQVVATANRIRRHSRREPWLTILPAAGQLALLERAGWSALSTSDEIRGMLLVLARPV